MSLIPTFLFIKKKKRRLRQIKERNGETMKPRQSSIQQIANNSLIGTYQELPDSGRAELVDPNAPVAYELMDQRPSDGTSMLRYHAPRSKSTKFVFIDMSTQSRTSVDTSSDTQYVQTQKLETKDLNRSLPPTPISESPQASPVAVNFNRAIASRRGRDVVDGRSAAVESTCERTMGYVLSPTHLNAWQRRFAHKSYASMDMEIVVPPGLSEVEIIKPLNVIKKTEECRRNFF